MNSSIKPKREEETRLFADKHYIFLKSWNRVIAEPQKTLRDIHTPPNNNWILHYSEILG